MGTTTNYNWPIPEDTDLVKDGAEAIRDLGNAIDTTVDGLGGGGLIHIETRTVSAAAAESFNNVFSADYDFYKVIMSLTNSTSLVLTMRYRTSGTDNSTSNYYTQTLQASNTSVTASRVNNAGNLFTVSNNYGGSGIFLLEIGNPFANNKETNTFASAPRGAFSEVNIRGNNFFANTSFDGFSVIASTGNITGSISVFGYRKA
jgi:hypothetical protein